MINDSFTVRKIHQQKDYQSKPHFHDVNEILITSKGEANMVIDNKEYELTSGSMVFISSGTLHCKMNKVDGELNSFVFHYPTSLLSELSTPKTNLYEMFAGYNGCLKLGKKDLATLLKHIGSLYALQSEGDKTLGNDLMDLCVFARILVQSAQLIRTSESNFARNYNYHYRDDKNIADIVKYIDSHLEETITLEMLAEKFYLNKYSICHAFKSKTGFTVNTYINMRRIQLASVYLKQGLSVNEVAKRTGFNSTAHFIRTFKALVNTTPKQFAQMYREGQNIAVSYNLFELNKE